MKKQFKILTLATLCIAATGCATTESKTEDFVKNTKTYNELIKDTNQFFNDNNLDCESGDLIPKTDKGYQLGVSYTSIKDGLIVDQQLSSSRTFLPTETLTGEHSNFLVDKKHYFTKSVDHKQTYRTERFNIDIYATTTDERVKNSGQVIFEYKYNLSNQNNTTAATMIGMEQAVHFISHSRVGKEGSENSYIPNGKTIIIKVCPL